MKQDQKIGITISRLSNQIERAMFAFRPTLEAAIPGAGEITGLQAWVIGYLNERDGEDVYQRDIEKELNIRRPTASGILQLMEKKDLIVREVSSRDARLKKIILTPRALAVFKLASAEAERMTDQMTKGLTDEELRRFVDMAEKMRLNLETED